LHFERFELSKDTVSNRLIKYAIWLLASPLADYTGLQRETIRNLNGHLSRFNGVKLDHSLSFIRPTEQLIRTKGFPQIRPYYVRLCQISLYILKTLGLDILNTGAEATLPSFVIDLETTFEKYILRMLQHKLPKIIGAVQVLDGNAEGARELFINQRGYLMTPDIVVLKEGRPLLIADVKYKAKPIRDDRSQVVTYAVGYGTSLSLLICPASGGQRQGLRQLGVVNNQIQVDEYYFNLATDNLGLEEDKLAQTLARIIVSNT
jgi:5-methylcytosine-specific restriction endonuclease McrBC regulatory subunit McrC